MPFQGYEEDEVEQSGGLWGVELISYSYRIIMVGADQGFVPCEPDRFPTALYPLFPVPPHAGCSSRMSHWERGGRTNRA